MENGCPDCGKYHPAPWSSTALTATITPAGVLRCRECGEVLADHEMFGDCYAVAATPKGAPSSLVKRASLIPF